MYVFVCTHVMYIMCMHVRMYLCRYVYIYVYVYMYGFYHGKRISLALNAYDNRSPLWNAHRNRTCVYTRAHSSPTPIQLHSHRAGAYALFASFLIGPVGIKLCCTVHICANLQEEERCVCVCVCVCVCSGRRRG